MRKIIAFLACCLIFIVSSCGDKTIFTPTSSGRPYEVLIVMSNSMWDRPIGQALFTALDSDVPGLPQSERSFRITKVDPKHFNQTFKIFRNIIITDIAPTYTQTKLKYTRDVYASPQMIMTIQGPSEEDAAQYLQQYGQQVVDFFTKVEMNRQIRELKKKHNQLASQLVDSIFGCDIWIPTDLQSHKRGKDFLWVSTNRANADLNFVMYTYPYRDKRTFTLDYFVHKRDSVMQVNIPGECEGMYMETDTAHVSSKNISIRGKYAQDVRGLWDVKNDIMGGPFVSHAVVDEVNGRVVVVEGFVYSPDKLKRNYMRLMEAALYTLKLPQEQELPEIVIEAPGDIQEEEIDTVTLQKKL